MALNAGSTVPGKTNWSAYGKQGIYVDIDTSGAGFPGTPLYFASIAGDSNHWATVGASAIYNATATGFRVYIRWVDGGELDPEYANKRKWHIHWHGVSNHFIHEEG